MNMGLFADRTIVVAVVASAAAAGAPAGEPPDLIGLFEIVNNHNMPCPAREQAEYLLVEHSHDISGFEPAFRALSQPVGERQLSMMAAYSGYSGSGSAARDCRDLPVHAQIAYSRFRLWTAFARNAQPEEQRQQAYALLFENAITEIQVRQLISESHSNWTPQVREALLVVYENPQWLPHTRRSVANSVYGMHHATPRAEQAKLRERLIATAWNERGTEMARLVAETLGRDGHYDPRVALLRVDLYEHEAAAERRRLPKQNTADLIDGFFRNVSGLYVNPRSVEADRRDSEVRGKRSELSNEARETGDDTKLREYEAELAERQRQELETRIERIDEWIAANRERLEQEAVEYEPGQQRRPEPRPSRELRRPRDQ